MNVARLLELYERMMRIRAFEERIAMDFRDGEIPGIVHLSLGQEAVAAGVSINLHPDDYVVTTHRGHGHLLAKGAPMNELMAEIWGKATGVCGGKGGSMHIAHVASGGMGANSVVGAGQPYAAGIALALRHRKDDAVVVTYFGDGAITTGAFHEGAVMAAVFALPILYVGENNGYSETTGASFHLRGGSMTDALRGYGFRSDRVDGMDVAAVDRAAQELLDAVRTNAGPAFLECETYRYHGHFEGDPTLYRSTAEVEEWKGRDPIPGTKRRLLELGADASAVGEIDVRVHREVDKASQFAAASPLPEPEQTLEGVLI